MTVDARKVQELEELRTRVRELETQVEAEKTAGQWPPKGFYAEYYATTGFILGMFGAAMSLLVNVIGAPIAKKSPLELIRIYLTFPLGEKALELASGVKDVYVIGDGVILAWLQPLLFGGNWITNPEYLPSWVALVTHLIFGWTLALLYPWTKFQPYTQPTSHET